LNVWKDRFDLTYEEESEGGLASQHTMGRVMKEGGGRHSKKKERERIGGKKNRIGAFSASEKFQIATSDKKKSGRV